MPRIAEPLTLNMSQRAALETLVSRRTTAQGLAKRAGIVLACAEGLQNNVIAQRLGVHKETVATWRKRFIAEGFDGLYDAPRPGAPRTITDAQAEAVIIQTLESTPRNATHWSSRMMAAESGVSTTSVQRIWRAFGLQPHRSGTFTLSTDPLFIDKVRDVVGLYLNPPERALVLCVDEKSQIQALDPRLVRQTTTLACALYADRLILVEHGRALLCENHRAPDQAWRPPQRTRAYKSHPRLHRNPKRGSKALQVGPHRRLNP